MKFWSATFVLPPACALFVLAVCGPTGQLKGPDAFARYEDAKPHFKAISADGIRMQTRRVDNRPSGNVELWLDSVRVHLKHEGYRIVEEGEVAVRDGGRSGRRLTALYRFAEQDYVYMVTLFVRGDYVFLVEAAGPYALFTARKQDIEASLSTFQAR